MLLCLVCGRLACIDHHVGQAANSARTSRPMREAAGQQHAQGRGLFRRLGLVDALPLLVADRSCCSMPTIRGGGIFGPDISELTRCRPLLWVLLLPIPAGGLFPSWQAGGSESVARPEVARELHRGRAVLDDPTHKLTLRLGLEPPRREPGR